MGYMPSFRSSLGIRMSFTFFLRKRTQEKIPWRKLPSEDFFSVFLFPFSVTFQKWISADPDHALHDIRLIFHAGIQSVLDLVQFKDISHNISDADFSG